ncbi:hypothetical protein Z043_125323, partial [Scleropages formosus]
HVDINVVGCQTGDIDPEDEVELDGDELFYVDFAKQEVVSETPDFIGTWGAPGWVQQALAHQQICKNNLDVAVKAEQNPTEEFDPPQVTIYPRDEVSVERRNTLICSANNFFPPPV